MSFDGSGSMTPMAEFYYYPVGTESQDSPGGTFVAANFFDENDSQ